jgi:glycerophosphoryl diester phosphodiesterase
MKFIILFLFSLSLYGQNNLIAHKGSWRDYKFPVNTLKSFNYAMNSGFDGIELDVRLTKDEVLVVGHDDKLIFTSDCRKKISQSLWSEIKGCNKTKSTMLPISGLFRKKTKFSDKLTNLNEVFEEFLNDDRVKFILIDVKDYELDHLQRAFKLILNNHKIHSKMVFSNRNIDFLVWLKSNYPDVQTSLQNGVGTAPLTNYKKYLKGIGITHDIVTLNMGFPIGHESIFKFYGKKKRLKRYIQDFANYRDEKQFSTIVWTINTKKSFKRIKDANFKFIVTDKIYSEIPSFMK